MSNNKNNYYLGFFFAYKLENNSRVAHKIYLEYKQKWKEKHFNSNISDTNSKIILSLKISIFFSIVNCLFEDW